jgi:hypothetical protein
VRVKKAGRGKSMEMTMDAKWNNIVDNMAVRIGMMTVVFGAWIAISYGLLSA